MNTLAIAVRWETSMTTILKSRVTMGLLVASCMAATATAHADDRLLKLLQLQTLNRTAPTAAPNKKNNAADNSTRKDEGADGRSSQPQPYNRGSQSGSTPPRRP